MIDEKLLLKKLQTELDKAKAKCYDEDFDPFYAAVCSALNTTIKMIKKQPAFDSIGTVDQLQQLIKYYSLQDRQECEVNLAAYRLIGSVKEFRILKERSIAKKPIRQPNHDMTYEEITCATCGRYISKYANKYCECGQKIDWE